jgi:hypothetical protein
VITRSWLVRPGHAGKRQVREQPRLVPAIHWQISDADQRSQILISVVSTCSVPEWLGNKCEAFWLDRRPVHAN